MKKRIVVSLMTFLVLLFFVCAGNITVYANDNASYGESGAVISGGLLTLDKATDALDSPSDSGKVVHTFAAGEAVFVTGEDSGYETIFYQGQTLYIKKDEISDEARESSATAASAQKSELTSEFEQKAETDVNFVDSYMRQKASQRNALIWKIIIGVLVVALIAVSVVIAIKSKNTDSDEEADKDQDKDGK